jgi:hypothetical protein
MFTIKLNLIRLRRHATSHSMDIATSDRALIARGAIRMGLMVAGIVLLGGCSPIYTPPWGWAVGIDQKENLTPVDVDKAATKAFHERFHPDLTACVATYDPQCLYEMENGSEYRISGWFVSTARTAPVQSCMIRKGWQPSRCSLVFKSQDFRALRLAQFIQ